MRRRTKKILLIDCCLGIWTLLWFVGFCFMTDQWRQEPKQDLEGWNGRNSVQAALAFTFFSVLIWVVFSISLITNSIVLSSFRAH